MSVISMGNASVARFHSARLMTSGGSRPAFRQPAKARPSERSTCGLS